MKESCPTTATQLASLLNEKPKVDPRKLLGEAGNAVKLGNLYFLLGYKTGIIAEQLLADLSEFVSPEQQSAFCAACIKEFKLPEGSSLLECVQAYFARDIHARHLTISCINMEHAQKIQELLSKLTELEKLRDYAVGLAGVGFPDAPDFACVRVLLSDSLMRLIEELRRVYRAPDPSEMKNGALNETYNPHITTFHLIFRVIYAKLIELGYIIVTGIGCKQLGRGAEPAWEISLI